MNKGLTTGQSSGVGEARTTGGLCVYLSSDGAIFVGPVRWLRGVQLTTDRRRTSRGVIDLAASPDSPPKCPKQSIAQNSVSQMAPATIPITSRFCDLTVPPSGTVPLLILSLHLCRRQDQEDHLNSLRLSGSAPLRHRSPLVARACASAAAVSTAHFPIRPEQPTSLASS
jgi:hypothetical protein